MMNVQIVYTIIISLRSSSYRNIGAFDRFNNEFDSIYDTAWIVLFILKKQADIVILP